MSATLVLCLEHLPELGGGDVQRERRALVPAGIDPQAAWWALLGQDPAARWTGLPPVWLGSVGRVIAEDETGYVLRPVRAEPFAEVQLGAGPRRRVLEALAELLDEEDYHASPFVNDPTEDFLFY